MITVYTGHPGSCKTTYLASVASNLLAKNQALYNAIGVIRPVYSNIKFSPLFEEKYSAILRYYEDIYKLHTFTDCDIIIDELSIYFDAQEWERLPKRVKRYLRLHRHYGVDIYAVAQDFLTIDKTFRRLVKELYLVDRILGTAEPSPYKPPMKRPFVFSAIRSVETNKWELEKEHYTFQTPTTYRLFTKKDFAIFNTREELPEQALPPLIKQTRVCLEDGHTVTKYI